MQKSAMEQILIGLDWGFRLLLAALFLYAAWPKILDPAAFAKAITNYRLSLPGLGQNYVFLAAFLIPPLEAVSAVGLFIKGIRRGSALTVLLLLAVFTVMILQAVLRGLNIDCGCYGASPTAGALASKAGWSKIAENAGLLVAAIYLYKRACPPKPRYKL